MRGTVHPQATNAVPSTSGRPDLPSVVAAQQGPMFRVAIGICGDADLAEEAVAEAFARSWPALERGTVDDPKAYLRRAVVNVLNGRFRRLALERRARQRRHGDARGPSDAVGDVAARDVVLRALRALPERQRAVVVLRYYEGMTEAEVATELGIPVGSVKSAGSRAAARLRALLQEDRHD